VRWNSPNLAFIHGCSAQLFFALMVALCVLTGRGAMTRTATVDDPDHLRRRSLVTLVLVYAQIVFGAQLRHFGSGLVLHAVMAAAVWGHALLLAWRVSRWRSQVPELIPSARAMALLVCGQVALGIAAWWMLRPFDGIAREVSTAQALVRIGHQGLGALLLASSVVLTLRAYLRLSKSPSGKVSAVRLRPAEAMA
jgi:cytochrome c oxidase assembly protein subunit 15